MLEHAKGIQKGGKWDGFPITVLIRMNIEVSEEHQFAA